MQINRAQINMKQIHITCRRVSCSVSSYYQCAVHVINAVTVFLENEFVNAQLYKQLVTTK